MAAHAILEQIMYAKLPPHPKELLNQADSQNGTYEQIYTHFENELQLKELDAPDEPQRDTVSQHAANITAQIPKPKY